MGAVYLSFLFHCFAGVFLHAVGLLADPIWKQHRLIPTFPSPRLLMAFNDEPHGYVGYVYLAITWS